MGRKRGWKKRKRGRSQVAQQMQTIQALRVRLFKLDPGTVQHATVLAQMEDIGKAMSKGEKIALGRLILEESSRRREAVTVRN